MPIPYFMSHPVLCLSRKKVLALLVPIPSNHRARSSFSHRGRNVAPWAFLPSQSYHRILSYKVVITTTTPKAKRRKKKGVKWKRKTWPGTHLWSDYHVVLRYISWHARWHIIRQDDNFFFYVPGHQTKRAADKKKQRALQCNHTCQRLLFLILSVISSSPHQARVPKNYYGAFAVTWSANRDVFIIKT